ncbi:MAG: excinuclease ABC subunit A [Flavobacteriaceae bacterium]|jgi:excinuclease ABC subunit A
MSKKETKIEFTGTDKITIKGARMHNLKNISLEIPRNKMVVFTGLSGSGKSSLAFDTIFAEGQRRYIESLSSYARQFLQQMPKPEVEEITGLSPAISIDQKSRSGNPRSTVATITEIYDYLRVLYARLGRPYSPISGNEIKKLSNQEIIDFILLKVQEYGKKTKSNKKILGVSWNEAQIQIWSPIVRGRKGEYYQMLYDLLSSGFTTVRIDGNIKSLREKITLSKGKKHDIDLLIDSFAVHEYFDSKVDMEQRIAESTERALNESEGLVRIICEAKKESVKGKEAEIVDEAQEEYLLSAKLLCPEDGFVFPEIEPRLFSFNSPYGACPDCKGLGTKHFQGLDVCLSCNGTRLREEASHIFLGGKEKGKNIIDFTNMTIEEAYDFVAEILPSLLSEKDMSIAGVVFREIESRLSFMLNVGLDYLALSRRANTLSGGESQRIRLASQLGSRLVGAMYVLDEPTIGLHQRDNEQLVKTLKNLRDIGNTIIVVEHDEDTIFASDYIVDIGPGAGVHGGEIVVSGDLDELLGKDELTKDEAKSRTLGYLRGDIEIPLPENRRTRDKGMLQIVGAKIHNIDNINVDIPLGKFVCITGVSGAGKSSFVDEILHKNLRARFDKRYRSSKVYNCSKFLGTEYITRSILVDQSPIGRTPRSNIATYTGAFPFIRELLAETEESRFRGWKQSRFSFNVKNGGRCEACEGKGMIAVEMHFLPTVYVTCDVCDGTRYEKETLKVKYKKKNIYDILQMNVESALEFFKDIPAIADRFKTLCDVGLSYISLGQSATTLSGGEAQRVKIASELYRPLTTKALYLLDEPTVGLHYDDVANLVHVLQNLVDRGNTVVVIEHSLDLVKCADHIIDFGPDGGSFGGKVVAKGTPEHIANTDTWTGKYLKRELTKHGKKKK